ncbi:MAG: FecR domain-containing protein [Sediminibacterium sp.]
MQRLPLLFDKYINNQISADECKEFWQLLQENGLADNLSTELQNLWLEHPKYSQSNAIWELKFDALIASQQPSIRKTSIIKYAVAALFVFLIGSICFLNFESKSPKNKSNKQLVNDVKPGHNGAILTLSNGKKVILDSAVDGETLSDANLGIIKKDGEIIYTGKTDELVYNTVTTDKGRQWRLTLPDGSKVWLNAQSSIHYPLNFTDKERVVEIAGEVFFEVVHNSKKPFKVKVGNKVIADIGTSFNINAYADESDMKTTLIEGSLSISNTRTNIPPTILEPGQQAVVNSTGFIRVNQHQDLDEVMAWKNGMFNFNETNIENIMRQIGRWYDLDIEYSGKITTETFSGMVSRNKSLIQVLKVLEQASIKFKIEGKKIIVIN